MGAFGERMRVSCRVRCARYWGASGVIPYPGGRNCDGIVRFLCLCVWDKQGHDCLDGVFPFTTARLSLFSARVDFVSRVLQFFNGDVRFLWTDCQKTARVSLVVDGGGLLVYGVFYDVGQPSNAVVVGVFRTGKRGVCLCLALLYDTADYLYSDYHGGAFLSPAKSFSVDKKRLALIASPYLKNSA